jgi:xanthine dehydrogenase accessory factor
MNNIFQTLANAARAGDRVTLGIITGVKGSSPQKLGAKAVFQPDGRIHGTLGGGCLEAEIQHRAIEALRSGTPATFELLLDHDFGWDDGLVCGGKVTGVILPDAQATGETFWATLADRSTPHAWGVTSNLAIASLPASAEAAGWLYRETVSPPCALWIAGAGHIAQAVAPLALQLDFAVSVFDDRPALANRQFFPGEVTLYADVWEKLLELTPSAAASFGLIVTRGHRHDALVLRSWIHRPFAFLGMIGSARKARTIFEHFADENLATPEQLRRVACPVGLEISSQTVPEIAVSIVAQLIHQRALLAGRPAPAQS